MLLFLFCLFVTVFAFVLFVCFRVMMMWGLMSSDVGLTYILGTPLFVCLFVCLFCFVFVFETRTSCDSYRKRDLGKACGHHE